jgi:hypothetical protein
LRMVKRVKRFHAELYITFFPEWKILEYTDVKVLNSRATDDTGGWFRALQAQRNAFLLVRGHC